MSHVPVLLAEVLEALAPTPGDIIVDGTFGAGGYSRALLNSADCRVIAIDRDETARPAADALAAEHPARFVWLLGNFADMEALLAGANIAQADGIVLDLGVSSMQLDQPERGFSFRHDGPLDMRMGVGATSAADWLNAASEAEIADVIYIYGEERFARRIARAIVAARAEATIDRTGALAEVVRSVLPRARPDMIDPATRTFQAIRIHVNDELGALKSALYAAERLLKSGGRLAVVSFHSLEDRIVKHFLKEAAGKSGNVSRHAPDISPLASPVFSLLHGGGVKPSATESRANPRARSARLRAAVRTPAPARPFAVQSASLGGLHAL